MRAASVMATAIAASVAAWPPAVHAQDDAYESVVVAPDAPPDSTAVVVAPEEARRLPGTDDDPLQAAHDLPGVGRAPTGSGQLVLWGAAPQDSRIYVDGVPIPALYHRGGLRGVVHSELVGRLTLVPGAYGPAYGGGLGGLVLVETRPLEPAALAGHVALDVLDASAFLSTAPTDRTRLAVGARRSHLDALLGDTGDFFPLPRYEDVVLKATHLPSSREEVDAVLLYARDRLVRRDPAADPAAERSESFAEDFVRTWVYWTRRLHQGGTVSLTPFFGREAARRRGGLGDTTTTLDTVTWRGGVRGDYRVRVHPRATLTLGVDVDGRYTQVRRAGSIGLPPREGDVTVFAQPPGDEVNADVWTADVTDVASFVAVDWTLGRLTLTPAIRLDAYALSASRRTPRIGATPGGARADLEVALDPRLAAAYRLTRHLTLHAAAGRYHAPPDANDLSAVFGNPTLGLSVAHHAAAGARVRLPGDVAVEVTAYYEDLDALPVRSANPTPRLAGALVDDGAGRTYGGQAFVRRELWRGFFGWIAYSVGRAERERAGEAVRLSDYDQTHVATAVASQAVGPWTFGARARYATGFPRTPVVDAYYQSRDDRWEPVFGRHNGARLPPFVQVDVRVDRSFSLADARFTAYAEVLNLTARENAEEVVYDYDFQRRRYVTGLPTLAVVGVQVDF